MASEFQSLIKSKDTGSSRSMKDIILKYLSYYPLFLLFLALSISAAYIYLRYAVPMYAASTLINVKGETTSSKNGGGNSSGDLIANAMNGGRAVINLDNELARLRSARLMEQVVRSSDLNISYYLQGNVLKTDIYHNAPFRLIPRDIQDSSQKIEMVLTKLTSWGFTIRYGDEKAPKLKAYQWNRPFTINNNTYLLSPLSSAFDPKEKYIIEWHPVMMTVYELLPKVSADVMGKTSNISLNINIENPYRGEDVLNKMVYAFIQMNLDDQNRAAQDKIYFIEERLGKVSGELGDVEKNLANYQGSNLLINGKDASGNYGEPLGAANTAIAEINTKFRLLSMLRNLLTDPSSQNRVLPSAIGFDDPVLGNLIVKYNELLLKKQRETPLVAGNSLMLKDIDNQLQGVRSSILDNLQSIDKALKVELAQHQRQGNQYKASVSALPQKERILDGIAREKSVKENLYLYLLQKREEAAISKTSTSPYEQIDLANSYGPVSPNKRSVYQYAFILGLIIPASLLFLKETFSDKVNHKEDIKKITGLPVVGEISFIKKLKRKKILPVFEGGIISEQFRIMRTNFKLLHQTNEQQVILITSSVSGEGKSFVSQNLAAIWAKSGKKVALLEFDIRKPADTVLSPSGRKGLADYLNGTVILDDIIQVTEECPYLHIYPSGSVIEEAGDLLDDKKVASLFELLKREYDVIVINAAPIGLVSDAFTLQQYSNAIGYVVRQGYTTKKQLGFLNPLIESGKFKNTYIVFNGVRSGAKYGSSAYGYGKKNPYFNRKKKVRASVKESTIA